MEKRKRRIWGLVLFFGIPLLYLFTVVQNIAISDFANNFPEWLKGKLSSEYSLRRYLEFLLFVFFPVISGVTVYGIRIYNEKIRDYETDLDNHARVIARNYEDLSKYARQERLKEVFVTFASKHPEVWAVQLYSYTKRHKWDGTEIKVEYVEGHVSEGNDLNAILQQYYRVDKKTYSQYLRAKRLIQTKNKSNFSKVVQIIQEIDRTIQNTPLEKIDATHAIQYAYLNVILDKLSETLGKKVPFIHQNPEKHEKLLEELRTGILKGIEIEDAYSFERLGHGGKSGRSYLTRVITYQGLPHIFLITLNSEYVPIDEYEHVDFIRNLALEFENMLIEALEISYN